MYIRTYTHTYIESERGCATPARASGGGGSGEEDRLPGTERLAGCGVRVLGFRLWSVMVGEYIFHGTFAVVVV